MQEEMYDSTAALPGSNEKVQDMAKRAIEGLPLWHSKDRQTFDDSNND